MDIVDCEKGLIKLTFTNTLNTSATTDESVLLQQHYSENENISAFSSPFFVGKSASTDIESNHSFSDYVNKVDDFAMPIKSILTSSDKKRGKNRIDDSLDDIDEFYGGKGNEFSGRNVTRKVNDDDISSHKKSWQPVFWNMSDESQPKTKVDSIGERKVNSMEAMAGPEDLTESASEEDIEFNGEDLTAFLAAEQLSESEYAKIFADPSFASSQNPLSLRNEMVRAMTNGPTDHPFQLTDVHKEKGPHAQYISFAARSSGSNAQRTPGNNASTDIADEISSYSLSDAYPSRDNLHGNVNPKSSSSSTSKRGDNLNQQERYPQEESKNPNNQRGMEEIYDDSDHSIYGNPVYAAKRAVTEADSGIYDGIDSVYSKPHRNIVIESSFSRPSNNRKMPSCPVNNSEASFDSLGDAYQSKDNLPDSARFLPLHRATHFTNEVETIPQLKQSRFEDLYTTDDLKAIINPVFKSPAIEGSSGSTIEFGAMYNTPNQIAFSLNPTNRLVKAAHNTPTDKSASFDTLVDVYPSAERTENVSFSYRLPVSAHSATVNSTDNMMNSSTRIQPTPSDKRIHLSRRKALFAFFRRLGESQPKTPVRSYVMQEEAMESLDYSQLYPNRLESRPTLTNVNPISPFNFGSEIRRRIKSPNISGSENKKDSSMWERIGLLHMQPETLNRLEISLNSRAHRSTVLSDLEDAAASRAKFQQIKMFFESISSSTSVASNTAMATSRGPVPFKSKTSRRSTII